MHRNLILTMTLMTLAAPRGLVAAEPPVQQLKDFAFAGRSAQAKALFESKRPSGDLDPEWLAAMSWVGRAGVFGEDWDLAADYAEATLKAAETLLENRPLGSDPDAPLAIAVGAAVETLGKFYVAKDDRGQAITFLRDKARKYADTGVETRINKNLLLLDLEGKQMPPVDASDLLSARRMSADDLRGNVALFFFWAHWCSDCRAQKPVLAELERRYGSRGFKVVAPTRLYGYIERGRDVSPDAERAYIESRHVKGKPLLGKVPVPLSGDNFVKFGVSTTPTLVLVDRAGTVRLYHPGEMTESALAERIEALL